MTYIQKTIYFKPRTKKELLDIILEKYFGLGKYNLNSIDTSLITDMSGLFMWSGHKFDVSGWNTENVKNMCGMFHSCSRFNCDISKWNINEVRNMRFMLCDCSKFNCDLSEWNLRGKKCFGTFDGCSIREEWKPKYYDLYIEDEDDE